MLAETIILKQEDDIQLHDRHVNLLKKSFVLEFVKESLISSKQQKLEIRNEGDEIYWLIRVMRIGEYKILNKSENDFLMDLKIYTKNSNLSYMAKKKITTRLSGSMKNQLHSFIKLDTELKSNLLQIFEQRKVSFLTTNCSWLSNIDFQRQCYKDITRIQNCNLKFLKNAIELKLGPYVSDELKSLNTDMLINQTKVNLVRKKMVNDLINNSENSHKALKKVEAYITHNLTN